MNQRRAASFPARDHDHTICVTAAVWRAKARCLELGIKWTELREQIFRHVATSHKPVSAYDLIESLAKEGKRLAPVSVYRILDVLQGAGLVHRIESRNAFFACMTNHPDSPRTITFLCEDCDRVTEVEAPDALSAISKTSEAGRFFARSTVVEVSGTCAECRDAGRSRDVSC
jgi:Fur family transcriptional regulator, zinc uptake regulator